MHAFRALFSRKNLFNSPASEMTYCVGWALNSTHSLWNPTSNYYLLDYTGNVNVNAIRAAEILFKILNGIRCEPVSSLYFLQAGYVWPLNQLYRTHMM